ncbi:hypothetical protein ACT3CD_04005 [Geofilum sp. OHC36d9]|uniref:hypothetical protein n=1 Tax=Geofilum sp. OHC36d9 TaxID=3458413 RepID=UPI004034BA79
MQINKTLTTIYYFAMLLILGGIILHITEINFAVPVLITGLIPVLAIRIYNWIMTAPEDRRRSFVYVFSGLALAAAVTAIYFNRSYWIIFVALSALLDFYYSFRAK